MDDPVGDHARAIVAARSPVEWTWEEHPVGEHQWEPFRTFDVCRVCDMTYSDWLDLNDPCSSKRERRRVTPWEPVPQEDEKGSSAAVTRPDPVLGATGAAGAGSGEAGRTP